MLEIWKTKLAKLSREFHFRFALAVVLVSLHVFAFSRAADDRLGISFNSSDDAPYFSNPDAPQVSSRFPRQPHHWSRLAVSRWDAQHYIAFAIRGISSCPKNPKTATDVNYVDCGLAWFPAYGSIAGAINDVTGVAPDVILVLLSCLAALIANLLWTSKTIVDRIGRGPAYAALVAFNVFPSAFFAVTPYPDLAVVALALGAFIFLTKDRWLPAAALIGAATALTPSAVGLGLGLIAAAIASAMRRHEEKEGRWWRPLYAIPLCVWGVALTFLVYRIVLGDAFVFFRAQAAFTSGKGDHGVGQLLDPVFYLKGFTAQNLAMLGVLGGAAMIVLAARELKKTFKFDELMFLGVSAAMVILRELSVIASRGGGYWQLERLLLSCPIVFLATAIVARKHRAVFAWWLLVCVGLYWYVELCSYLTHGDPRVCPCLGKFEAWMPWQS